MPDKARLTLRLPPTLAAEAQAQAQAAGVSLNVWLTLGVRNWVTCKRRDFPPAPAATPPQPKAVSRKEPTAGRPAASLPLANPAKVGRNDPCPCGSGLKFKRCHGQP